MYGWAVKANARLRPPEKLTVSAKTRSKDNGPGLMRKKYGSGLIGQIPESFRPGSGVHPKRSDTRSSLHFRERIRLQGAAPCWLFHVNWLTIRLKPKHPGDVPVHIPGPAAPAKGYTFTLRQIRRLICAVDLAFTQLSLTFAAHLFFKH